MKARLSLSVLGLVVTLVTVPARASGQVPYEIVSEFETALLDGAYPSANLVQTSDGSFFGVTAEGGWSNLAGYGRGAGTVFKIDTAGKLTVLHRFSVTDGASPQTALIQASDGRLYGTTPGGGASGFGTIFSIDADGTLTTLHSFNRSDGAQPGALVEGDNGRFYGTTNVGGASGDGTIFTIDAAGTLTTLHSFNHLTGLSYPSDLTRGADGDFYGTTSFNVSNYGGIFKISPAGALTVLYQFPYRRTPSSGLLLARDGSFYGTTGAESPHSGTVFKMDAAGAVTFLHYFTGNDDTGADPTGGLTQATDGTFYGVTRGFGQVPGTIFKFDAGGMLVTLHRLTANEGVAPVAGLIQAADGHFYGTASAGGEFQAGTVIKIDAAGTLTRLHSFGGPGEGASPIGLVEGTDGRLYGTSSGGGGFGTVFSLDGSGMRTLLRRFSMSEGYPNSGLIQAADGKFYGTTSDRPPPQGQAAGTIFSIDATGTLTIVHAFAFTEGGPQGGVIQASNGSFYGSTAPGAGSGATQAVFRIDPTGKLTTLRHLLGNPVGRLLQAADGNLYGIWLQIYGPRAGSNYLFSADLSGTLLTEYELPRSLGFFMSGVIEATDGAFYGTTSSGGPSPYGTVFRIDRTGGLTVTALHHFTGLDGADPVAGLIQASDGRFYGTTSSGGTFGFGTIFSIDASGTLKTLHNFSGADGAAPNAAMIQARDGHLYGTTASGGSRGGGVVFRIPLPLNGAPLAADDAYRLTANTTLLQAAPGVLGNDTDPDGDPLTAILVDGAAHGEVVLNADGSFSYTPDADFYGQDSFRYRVDDGGGLSGVATVFITVDPPTAPVLTLSTTALAFSPQPLRQPSAPRPVVVTNSGTGTLQITEVAIAGPDRQDFTETSSCATALGPGQQCVVQVTFAPRKKGVRQASLLLSHNASTQPARVSLTGTGVKVKSKH